MASNLYNKCADIKAKLDGILLKTDSIINSGLPYVELEYIESTGTQYIETNYIPNNNTKIQVTVSDIKPVSGVPNAVIFSASTSWVYKIFALTYQNQHSINGWRYMLPSDIVFGADTYTSKNTIEVYRGSVKFNDSIIQTDTGIYTMNNLSTLHFCGENRYSDNGYQNNYYKTHSFKIYESDNLIHHYIPVTRKSDSVVCVYDLITKQFLENAGTGTFIAGPTVKGRLPNLNTDKLLLQLYGNNITSNTTWTNLINSSNLTVSNGIRDESTNSMTFNGSSTIIDTGIAQSTLSSGYTMVLRFLPNSWTNYKGLFGLHDTGGENGIVGLQYQDGNIYFGHRNNGNNSVAVSSSKLYTNTWHVAICKFDGTYLYLYIDGTYIGKTSSNTPLTSTGNVIIGKSYNSGDRFFYGKISDILLYKRAITDGEINYIFKNI